MIRTMQGNLQYRKRTWNRWQEKENLEEMNRVTEGIQRAELRSSYKQILGQIEGQAPNNGLPIDMLWFEMT